MIGKIFGTLLNVVRFQKFKIFSYVMLTLFFAMALFPYSDLSDYVTSKVAQLTQNKVYLRFDDMTIRWFPTPAIKMEKVSVETAAVPRIQSEEMTIAPSLASLLSFKLGASIEASGLWDGEVQLTVKNGPKTENGTPTQVFKINSSAVSLQQFGKFMKSSVPMKGQLDMNLKVGVDPTYVVQPDGDVEIQIKGFQVIAANIPTPMGPINIPDVRVSELSLNGRISDGRLIVEESKLEKKGDDIHGTIKGNFGLRFQPEGGMFTVLPGAYNSDVDLVISKALSDKLGVLLILLDAYKRADSDGIRYAVRLQGNTFFGPPNISAK